MSGDSLVIGKIFIFINKSMCILAFAGHCVRGLSPDLYQGIRCHPLGFKGNDAIG